jgi:D-alanyl-D-alanine carboxypeptidase
MRDVYRKVTLAQLLTFQGGIQPYTMIAGPQAQALFSNLKGSLTEQRLAFVRHVLNEEPAAEPGTGRNYSNASYAIAAFLAARRTDQEWESIMREQVFGPLGMTRAGFGRPSNADHPNEPWLHTNGAGLRQKGKEKGKQKSASNEPYRPQPENVPEPAAMVAAGGVHCSIGDFCKFVAYELQSANGRDVLLKKETADRVRALFPRPDGTNLRGGSPFVSAGFNLWPSRNLAAVAMVNAGGAEQACTEIFERVNAGL